MSPSLAGKYQLRGGRKIVVEKEGGGRGGGAGGGLGDRDPRIVSLHAPVPAVSPALCLSLSTRDV